MLYGEVVTNFYRIGLSEADSKLVSEHFSGAVHHKYRAEQAQRSFVAEFHRTRSRAHVRHLMSIIYQRGDFTNAIDETLRDMENRESWNPDLHPIPNPSMLTGELLGPDVRFPVGVPHAILDGFLKDLRGPCEPAERRLASVALRGPISN